MKKILNKRFILIISILLILTAAVGGTVAFLTTQTPAVENRFESGRVTCEVVEEFKNGDATKKYVAIKNTGNTTAYIRAAIVGNWVKDNKVVAPWTFNETIGSGWKKGSDGYYYHKAPVAAEGKTSNLFDSYTAPSDGPKGSHLEMTIICQAIQSEPASAVEEAWDVTVGSNGQISPKSGN